MEDSKVVRTIRNVGHGGCYALYFIIVNEDSKWFNQKNNAKASRSEFSI